MRTFKWLRVYPEDMIGDAKVRRLSAEEKWYLVLAWQAARNGPAYGELRNPDGTLMTGADFGVVADISARKASDFLTKLLCFQLAAPAPDGAVSFPNLSRHQHDDLTATERKQRQRSRQRHGGSHGNVTEKSRQKSRSGHGTEDREQRTELLPTVVTPAADKPRNVQWDGLVAVFGYSPSTEREKKHWGQLVVELRRAGATEQSIIASADRYREAMPEVELTPPALVKHYERLMRGTARRGTATRNVFVKQLREEAHETAGGNGAAGAAGGKLPQLPPGGDRRVDDGGQARALPA